MVLSRWAMSLMPSCCNLRGALFPVFVVPMTIGCGFVVVRMLLRVLVVCIGSVLGSLW